MVENQSILASYRWPMARTWIVGGLGLLALTTGLRLATVASPIYQLVAVFIILGLIFRPEKRLRLVEDDDFILVQSAYSWNFFQRHKPFNTDFAATRASVLRAQPCELSWGEWWTAVRRAGRIEQLAGHAILVGLRRRGIAIPIDEISAQLAINIHVVSSGTESTTQEWSVGWGLFERRMTKTTERLVATFVFIPVVPPVDDSLEHSAALPLV